MQVDVASHGHEILPIRSPIIESAGEPPLTALCPPLTAIRKARRPTLKLFFLAFGPLQGWWLLDVCERKTDVDPAKFATTCSTPRKRATPALSSGSSFDFPIPGVIVLTRLR
jgi:hypothetical protein